ncbi:histone-lysine N-methyltransferase SETMAR [Trichonephila clavata]|uniref:Histone-lysine N-methyltransferase SETMAR n=1 Tax=Trichonephila clavata TaxID=2740835 RepID=A0A8X6FLG6_TRICU|nr:histone-lysine N-methyltransferase SETMAR [Trichonephila clavata]
MQANKKELRWVIRFLAVERVGGREMHQWMNVVSIICVVRVVEWSKSVLEGLELLEDDARPGQTHHVITPERIAEVNSSVLENHRITWTRSIGYWVLACHTIVH